MFRAHYMLAFGHYEQATNELAKAMTMEIIGKQIPRPPIARVAT